MTAQGPFVPANNREAYNPATRRWEYAPICADGIQRDLDLQAELRARETAIYERVNGKPRNYTATGTIRCEDCRGLGLIDADAGITGTNRFCDCSTCHGTGYRK